MYREERNPWRKVGVLGVIVALHGVGIAGLILAKGPVFEEVPESVVETFDVVIEPPPPIEDIDDPDQATPREEGEASARNVEQTASEVQSTESPVPPVREPPRAAPRPNDGNATDQGASDRDEGGTGSGGVGEGTGSGRGGDGLGGGGGTKPQLVTRTQVVVADFPRELRRQWEDGTVAIYNVTVNVDGSTSNCSVGRSSGIPEFDAEACRLIERKVRWQPARNAVGEPISYRYGYQISARR
ncbi:energy transducer TonB [Sphingomicrobium sediminis]|uniref:Energy transducer TonB n=1 Tax=Sphingomicrobium sediminis TaxID=2950949 RepID=A0A9X2EEZ2_9SPHN|nr:TonB family protein [Sphingomicrobium sediminis]MCM8556206.1 energy transducer TonB [Sphingomicrobium sediminis]